MNTAQVGDEIIVDSDELGHPPRKGEILEVLTTGGAVHYRVQWDNADEGHETLFFPGSTSHAIHPGGKSPAI